MDLVQSVIAFKQSEWVARVQYALAAKILDQQQQTGTAVLKLLDAANQGLTRASDPLMTATTGLGAQLDTYG
ncbi:MAG: hypothetical protein KatS3mg104_2102 [Phycisphaerae bacterium]|nr:MAG: hypothetical protein KatS3mg104_2102 [Phycisphaerae bacterium]